MEQMRFLSTSPDFRAWCARANDERFDFSEWVFPHLEEAGLKALGECEGCVYLGMTEETTLEKLETLMDRLYAYFRREPC